MSGPPIDITKLVQSGHTYTVSASNELPEEAQHRRARELANERHERRVELLTLGFSCLMVGVIFSGCIWLVAVGSPDDKKWAMGVVAAIASGLVGFIWGRRSK